MQLYMQANPELYYVTMCVTKNIDYNNVRQFS
jgi:hypothetical protein